MYDGRLCRCEASGTENCVFMSCHVTLDSRVLVELVSSATRDWRHSWRAWGGEDSHWLAPSGGRMPAAWLSSSCLKEASCKMHSSDCAVFWEYVICSHTHAVQYSIKMIFICPGMRCTWCTMVSTCHGSCSVTSGHVPTWWTVSSRGPQRKPSSLFSWPLPHPSASSSTWPNLPMLSPRLSLGSDINHIDSQVIN